MSHGVVDDMSTERRERWLLIRVRDHVCVLPLEHVSETMRPQPVRVVAGAPPFVRGVAVIRGAPVPVLDAAFLLLGEQPSGDETRFVSLRVADRQVALAVSEVLGVREIDKAHVSDLPPLLSPASAGVVAALGMLDSDLLLVLRAGRLVSEAVRAGINAEAAP